MGSPDGRKAAGGRGFLVAATPEARKALGGPEIELTGLPFRVGRESRKISWSPKGIVSERRDADRVPTNDLYLAESSERMNVSREHFQIEQEGDGWLLVDRGSTCGTLVTGEEVGGNQAGGRSSLNDADVIVVGTSTSPYVFRFDLR